MPDPRIEEEVARQLAARMDAQFIIDQLAEMPPDLKERFADDLAEVFWSAQRSRALKDSKQFVNMRFLHDAEEVTQDEDGTIVGLTGGKGQFDIVDFKGGQAWIDSASNARQLNVRVSGGGADCMFDYLVSSCWADEVAAGRGTEGQTMTSLSGCTFKVYSTVEGAMTAIDALSANDSSTVFICRGEYDEQVTVPSDTNNFVNIVGSGMGNTVIAPQSGSGSAVTFQAQTGDANVLRLADLTIDATGMSAGSDGLTVGSAPHFTLERLHIAANSTGSGIILRQLTSGGKSIINKCRFTGSSGSIGIEPTIDVNNVTITDNEFLDGLGVGVEVSPSSGTDMHLALRDNWFLSTVGVAFRSNGANQVTINDNHFINCTDGILFEDSTGGIQWRNITVNDNTFYGCTDGIDLDSTAGTILININDNTFRATSAGDVGIRGDATVVAGSVILGNSFEAYTSGNEMVDLDETTNEIAHNVTDSGATLPDSHIAGPSAHVHWRIQDADGDTYVSTEESADSDVIESATNGTIRSRLSALGLQLANGTDLITYSDAFTTATAELDAATGNLGLGDDDHSITLGGGSIVFRHLLHVGNVATLPMGIRYASSTSPSSIGARIIVARSRGTLASMTGVSSGDILGSWIFAGHDGTDFEQAAAINGEVDGTPGAGDMPGRLVFLTTPDGSSSPAEKFRLTSAGVWVATAGRERWPITAKTIASDQIAIASGDTGHYTLAGEGAAADDLDGITGGTQGDILILSPVSDSVTITITHNNAGGSSGAKIFTSSGSSITMDDIHDCAIFIYKTALDSGNGGWMQIGGSGGGSGATDAADLTYTPASNADWGGSDPGDTDQALDVLADRTSKGREYIRAEMFVPRVTSPAPPAQRIDAGSNDVTYRGIPFDASTDEYTTYAFFLPANYDAGTFTAKFIWTALSGSGDVTWAIRMLARSEGDAINTAMGSTVVVVDTLTTASDVHVSSATAAITPSGTPAANQMLFVEVFRDADASEAGADDDLAVDAYLIGVELIYGLTAAGVG